MQHWIIGTALGLAALPALAGGTLEGRQVSLGVLTYDDPAAPMLDATGRTVTVGAGVEFGMGSEINQNGFYVVPVEVEILPDRIELGYGAETGNFWPSAFNGYVLRFAAPGECVLFMGARIDRTDSTMPLADGDITVTKDAVFINVAGQEYGPGVHLAIDLDVAECTMS